MTLNDCPGLCCCAGRTHPCVHPKVLKLCVHVCQCPSVSLAELFSLLRAASHVRYVAGVFLARNDVHNPKGASVSTLPAFWQLRPGQEVVPEALKGCHSSPDFPLQSFLDLTLCGRGVLARNDVHNPKGASMSTLPAFWQLRPGQEVVPEALKGCHSSPDFPLQSCLDLMWTPPRCWTSSDSQSTTKHQDLSYSSPSLHLESGESQDTGCRERRKTQSVQRALPQFHLGLI